LFRFGRVPAGRAFGTRFFICPAGQIKRAQTMPLSLTQIYRTRDCRENPFLRHEEKIEAKARYAFRGRAQIIIFITIS